MHHGDHKIQDITIRKLREGDFNEYKKLLASLIEEKMTISFNKMPDDSVLRAMIYHSVKKMEDHRGFHYVAVLGMEIVGYAALSPIFENVDILELGCSVMKGYRSKKIGSNLVEKAMSKAAELKGKFILAHTSTKSAEAIKMMEKLGFHRNLQLKNTVKLREERRDDFIQMVKAI